MFRNSGNAGNAGNPSNTRSNNAGNKNSIISSDKITGTNVLKIILIVLIMVVIVGITIWIIDRLKRGSKKESKLSGDKYIQLDRSDDVPETLSTEKMPTPALGNDFTFNFWIYLAENYPASSNHKIIMYRGEKDGQSNNGNMQFKASSPIVIMDKSTNKMHIGVATNRANSAMSLDSIFFPNNPREAKYLTTTIDYIPLQRWVNITVMVIDNVMRVYLDGDIYSVASTSEIQGSPAIQMREDDLTIGSSNSAMMVHGFFANLRYFNHSIPQSQVKTIYASGPVPRSWLSWLGFPKYGLQSPIYKLE